MRKRFSLGASRQPEQRRGLARMNIGVLSLVVEAEPNKGVQTTAYSVRSCIAPASSGG